MTRLFLLFLLTSFLVNNYTGASNSCSLLFVKTSKIVTKEALPKIPTEIGVVEPVAISPDTRQHELLTLAFAIAIRGRNDSMRFGSLILEPVVFEVLGASVNRLSRSPEPKIYNQKRWSSKLSLKTNKALRASRRGPGAMSVGYSVHAEQGAMFEVLENFNLPITGLKGFRLFTIGITRDAKIGIANNREWTCLKCALWIDILKPRVFELFQNGFEIFGESDHLIETALRNQEAKKVGDGWKHVEVDGVKDSNASVYQFVSPEALIQSPATPPRLNAKDLTIAKAAIGLAAMKKYPKSGPYTQVMSFGSVLVDLASGMIIAEGRSSRTHGSEENAVQNALKKTKPSSLRNMAVFTVGLSSNGYIAVAQNKLSTCFGCVELQQKYGLSFYELMPGGFQSVNLQTAFQALGLGRFSKKFFYTSSDESVRVDNPFRYFWYSPIELGL